jgi:AcrR family transcriptional regulator
MDVAKNINYNDGARELILQAAEKRFSQFGYKKTTMAEIAKDADMSAANLYRYFENKQEIIAECARNYFNARVVMLKHAVNTYHGNACLMLENYLLTTLKYTHKLAKSNKKVSELIEYIKETRPEIIYERISTETRLIAGILQAGVDSGEFKVENLEETAFSVYLSTIMFELPTFMNVYTLEEFEDMAKSLIKTLITGIGK